MGCYLDTAASNVKIQSHSEIIVNELSSEFECKDSNEYSECKHINRLREILIYYNEWVVNHKDKDNNNSIGIYQYIRKVKKYSVRRLLNDYHHLLHGHLNEIEFEEIYNYFVEPLPMGRCIMNSCNMMNRNSRDRSNRNRNQKENKLYYLMELEEEIITEQILDQIHCMIYHTFDTGFKLTKKQKLEIDEEINDCKNDDDTNIDTNNNDRRRERIGMIIRNKKDKTRGLRGRDYNNNKFMTNILETDEAEEIQNDKDAMFSFGIRYYYDEKYKNNEDLDAEYNIGYPYNDWYINKKHNGLKEELLQNTNCKIEASQWNELYLKCEQYLKADHIVHNCNNIHINNLISLMIYCNFDILQCEYTKTYRYLNETESDFDLKQRHTAFANLGEALQNCVEKHGIRVEKGATKTFYHGINTPLLFTSTLHKFCGPISTSSAYEVAVVFTNNYGIILELNDGTLLSNEAECIYFDCEWISDFSYEKEKFFIGGMSPLKIVNIVHVKLNENYTVYIELINILLSIFKGDISITINNKNQKALIKLLKHYNINNNKKMEQIPIYVDKLFNHIFSNIGFITIKYDITFATDTYKILSQYLCNDQYQFFKLKQLTALFPNLTSIAVERNTLTSDIFDDIHTFLQQKTDSNELNNIIFKSPIHHKNAISFDQIIKKYNNLYKECKWSISISERSKYWLVVKSNDINSKHTRFASTNILKSQKTFNEAEEYELYEYMSDNM